mmetsp:Transcript_26431/g.38882  ORF Transcript_26431/g.38882 Transcript_26431/m.38882 type:complete len:248 (-) Transcript_26431:184-927(-)
MHVDIGLGIDQLFGHLILAVQSCPVQWGPLVRWVKNIRVSLEVEKKLGNIGVALLCRVQQRCHARVFLAHLRHSVWVGARQQQARGCSQVVEEAVRDEGGLARDLVGLFQRRSVQDTVPRPTVFQRQHSDCILVPRSLRLSEEARTSLHRPQPRRLEVEAGSINHVKFRVVEPKPKLLHGQSRECEAVSHRLAQVCVVAKPNAWLAHVHVDPRFALLLDGRDQVLCMFLVSVLLNARRELGGEGCDI